MRLTDKPLKIEGDACGKRIVDSLYKVCDNYYFLDTGWTEASSHPDHFIGRMVKSEKDRWEFMDDIKRLFVITPITDDDISWDAPMIEGYKRWKKYLKDKYPEANGADFIRRDLGLGDVEIEQVG